MKTLSGLKSYWKLSVDGFLVLGKTITLTGYFAIASSGDYVLAQITSDHTLGAESSQVTSPTPGAFQINGGATRGTNLFHSFSQFSVPTNGSAYFNNQLNIQNIITRVTGGSISNIDGSIRAKGRANLFLLNPNGIIFGPNASLNLGGSFLGSTASSAIFADGTLFSATATPTTPLLTISVPLGLQFGRNPGSIRVQGDGQGLRTTLALIDTTAGLRVRPNQTLALVGGDVVLEGGTLKTAGGRIELGSVAEPGLVSLTSIDKGWALGYDGISSFGDIQLSQQAAVDASGAGGGDIEVRGRRVTLTDGSQIESSTLRAKPGGTLAVRASDSIELIGTADGTLSSGFVAQVYQGATGTGGNLILETGRLSLQDEAWITTDTLGSGAGGNLRIETGLLNVRSGAQISASTYGMGAGGSLAVKASDSVQVIGTDSASNPSALFTFTQGSGAAGNLTIDTRGLIIKNGAQVVSGTTAKGQGGDLTINALDFVQVIGIAPDRLSPTTLSSSTIGEGAAGNLSINTGQLIIRDGAQVSTGSSFGSTFSGDIPAITMGTGRGGNLSVKASDSVQVIGTGQLFITPDGRFTSDLSNHSSGLFTQTQTAGAAGNLTLETGRLIIQDGAQVSASTDGQGAGGTLAVIASDSVQLLGTAPKEEFPSGLFTETRGTGAAGNLTIVTGQLIARDGGQVSASTLDKGQGGTLTVTASESTQLSGSSADGQWTSSLLTLAQGAGAAGNLRIGTGQLIVQDGAIVSSSSSSEGAAGNLTVNASGSVGIIGTTADGQSPSALLTQAEGTGDGGDLTIQARQLVVQDGAVVSSSSRIKGAAGNLTVNASDSVEIIGTTADGQYRSGLFTQTEGTGDAGDLTIQARQLIVRDGALVSARTFGEGKGGKLTVNASDSVEVIGTSANGQSRSSLSASTEGGGDAGNSRINTRQLKVREGAAIAVNSVGTGRAGNLEITADSVRLENQGFIAATTRAGDGGNITLQVKDLLLMRHGSRISTTAGTAQAPGDGGNITIDNGFIVALPQENSDITANAYTGRGGNVNITTQGIYGIEFRPQLTPLSDITASSQFGVNGAVTINTPDVDPSRGLAELPVEPVNLEVTQGCQTAGKQTSVAFFNTGRGGLAPNPYEPISSSDIWEDVPPSTQRAENPTNAARASASPATPPDQLVEAQGWIVNKQGKVTLIAEMPATRSQGRCRLR